MTIDNQTVGQISIGILALLGVEQGDTVGDANYIADKIAGLRIFPDADEKMNLALSEVNGEVLAISQFTLLGDCRKGRRPSFVDAAPPEIGLSLYEHCCERLRFHGISVGQGVFRADMQVWSINDGPVTLLLDSRRRF